MPGSSSGEVTDAASAKAAIRCPGMPATGGCLDEEVAVVSVSGVLTTSCSADSAVMAVVVDGVTLADGAFELTLEKSEHAVLPC